MSARPTSISVTFRCQTSAERGAYIWSHEEDLTPNDSGWISQPKSARPGYSLLDCWSLDHIAHVIGNSFIHNNCSIFSIPVCLANIGIPDVTFCCTTMPAIGRGVNLSEHGLFEPDRFDCHDLMVYAVALIFSIFLKKLMFLLSLAHGAASPHWALYSHCCDDPSLHARGMCLWCRSTYVQ